jgi:hypothetical protein
MLDKIVRERLRLIENPGDDVRNVDSFEWSDPLPKSELKEKLMAARHHAAHPPTGVKPNAAVNKKPEAYTPPEAADYNPSTMTQPGVDGMNQRRPRGAEISSTRDEQPFDLNIS